MGVTYSHLEALPSTRRSIVEQIKKSGTRGADDIAAHVGITVQAARHHLTTLERDGLLSHSELRDGMGRPKHLYALTPAGDTLFPRNYADLTNELLEYVEDENPELLDRIFDRRAQRRLEQARREMVGASFPQKVRVLAQILDQDGYLAEFQALADGTFIITEHNCAVLSVALRYGHACSSELDFLRAAIPEAEVTRIAHRIAGGHVCAYLIKPRDG
ncbi:MAG: helix-turn-helix transcriptional regulator [Chloroflexota bacterium]